jgi:hypothetical protein
MCMVIMINIRVNGMLIGSKDLVSFSHFILWYVMPLYGTVGNGRYNAVREW